MLILISLSISLISWGITNMVYLHTYVYNYYSSCPYIIAQSSSFHIALG